MLTKSLEQRLWDESKYHLRQLPGVGNVTAKVNALAGLEQQCHTIISMA